MDFEIQVARHAAYNGQLLICLFAEQRDVRPKLVKQFGVDSSDCIKMPRSRAAAQPFADAAHGTIGGKAGWILLLHRRSPQHIPAPVPHQFSIPCFTSRLAVQVLVGSARDWFKENRCHAMNGSRPSSDEQQEG